MSCEIATEAAEALMRNIKVWMSLEQASIGNTAQYCTVHLYMLYLLLIFESYFWLIHAFLFVFNASATSIVTK